jgi:transposase-like protein
MTVDLTDPIFNNEEAARAHFERLRWPGGPVCPHCGGVDCATELNGKSTRPGLYKCRQCQKPFTARIGTVYERSHIPLRKWLLATYLLCSSKKKMSAHQLWRTLGFGSYRTAWFMAMRIREGMREAHFGPLGGEGKFVEADETFTGGKARNRAYKAPPPKEAVMSLGERDGKSEASTSRKSLPQRSSRSSRTPSPRTRISEPTRAVYIGISAKNSPAIARSSTQLANTSAATLTPTLLKATFRS